MTKLSSPPRRRKRPDPRWRPRCDLLIALFATFALGCAAEVAEAPFAKRVDGAGRGDLLGPFDGRVLDAQTGAPVAGALVQASWALETGGGLTGPAGGEVRVGTTDHEGRYRIARLEPPLTSRRAVARFVLTIYRAGYVAYRSDRVFEAPRATRPRTDFVQRNNVAKLEAAAPSLSHARHVAFVGGAAALRRALHGETILASFELAGHSEGPAVVAPPAHPLDAGRLLSQQEIKELTGTLETFAVTKLGDLATSSSYDSVHFKAAGRPESFDVALRVWKIGTERAEAKFTQLLTEVPHAEARNEVADRSLRGYEGRILAAAALDKGRGIVIEITCGRDLCSDGDRMIELLKKAMGRTDRLDLAPPPSAPSAPAPAAPTTRSAPAAAPASEREFQLKPPELKR